MKKLFMLAALLCGIQNAGAAFIDSGTYLTDTTSGLDWLDVTASVNRSYNDVSSQFGVGGDFAGWRYATGAQFNTMIEHWPGAVARPFWEVIDKGIVQPEGVTDGLIAALGNTLDVFYVLDTRRTYCEFWGGVAGCYGWTIGLLDDAGDNNSRALGFIFDDDLQAGNSDYAGAYNSFVARTWHAGDAGSFLVRATSAEGSGAPPGGASIPEPGTLVLLGLGLAGLCFSRRKVKANGLS